MSYFPELQQQFDQLRLWLDVRHEQCSSQVSAVRREMSAALNRWRKRLESAGPGRDSRENEPDDLRGIRRLRPKGPRKLELTMTDEQLHDRLLGAWLGRAAGCILGCPVEGHDSAAIEAYAKQIGQKWPLEDYWKACATPDEIRYGAPVRVYTKPHLKRIERDDDLTYTVLGLLILEANGPEFTTEDVGRAWLKHLPMACTAEHVALENLRGGVRPPRTAVRNNPYNEWIGADIRSDPWGYAAAGLPELAAEMAHRDARLSHVKNGIYGEMFFSAMISAAFVVDDVDELVRIGLSEIPRQCRLARAVRLGQKWIKADGDWRKTLARVNRRFAGMHHVHTINNAVLTIAGLYYGEGDFTKTIGVTVSMGYDNDCTGATAGSICGAMLGAKKLPARWTKPLGDDVLTYIKGAERLKSSGLARRFFKVARMTRARFA
ncbi:MAG: ADP-ribosylglycohydrolase family protein [Phycisphaerae bacterium]|nr:ADP-ribosylglycohydrolase family protein [Phycisphaerae bacterium]